MPNLYVTSHALENFAERIGPARPSEIINLANAAEPLSKKLKERAYKFFSRKTYRKTWSFNDPEWEKEYGYLGHQEKGIVFLFRKEEHGFSRILSVATFAQLRKNSHQLDYLQRQENASYSKGH